MGIFGRGRQADQPAEAGGATDAEALARYRYLLRTAPPEEIERAHEEAFAQLTPEQRRQALAALAEHVPAGEIRGDDPASLARTATRAEMRQPGTIERAWGGPMGAGIGLGGWFMTTLAASFIGTAVAQALFDNDTAAAEAADAGANEADGGSDAGSDPGDVADSGDAGTDLGGDFGGGDFGGF